MNAFLYGLIGMFLGPPASAVWLAWSVRHNPDPSLGGAYLYFWMFVALPCSVPIGFLAGIAVWAMGEFLRWLLRKGLRG
jgi:hypothetical protein